MTEYENCSVCGKELPEALKQYAVDKFERCVCSSECRRKDIIKRFACCEKAEIMECVCAYAFECKIHGRRHVGTHD